MNQGPATYLTYLDNQRAFEAIGAWESNQVSITGRGEPEQVEALAVTHTTLGVLRVQPLLGRFFSREDDTPGGPPRAVLSYGYWQRRFGGARNVIGQLLEVDGTPSEVIGVLPSSFKFLRTDPAVLLPMQLGRASAFRGIEFDFQAVARLKPGVLLSHANADVARMIPLLPRTFETLQLQSNVRPLADDVIGDVGRVLWILLAAVGIVLLIACGNVANLFLIRAERRQQEFAVRAALGASRSRIAQALLAESVTLALAGGAVGLGLAHATVRLLQGIAPAELPRVDEIGIDATVLSFTLIISVLSGALFGLFAVLKFGRPGVAALKEGGRSAGDAPGRHRTRNALVVAQIAPALILTIVSGLMIRTFLAMRQVEPGFVRPESVQTFRIAIPERLISDDQQVARTHESIARRLEQVPGVHLRRSLILDHDGRGGQRQSAVRGASCRGGRPAPTAPPIQELRPRLLRDNGQSSRGLRHGLSLTAVGVALGIGVALVLTRVMSALLFGIGPTDLMTYASVSGMLAAVALLATYLPARRASSVDPMVALRAEV